MSFSKPHTHHPRPNSQRYRTLVSSRPVISERPLQFTVPNRRPTSKRDPGSLVKETQVPLATRLTDSIHFLSPIDKAADADYLHFFSIDEAEGAGPVHDMMEMVSADSALET